MSQRLSQRLSQHRPETLGQASRLSGITPATISLLLIHLKKSKFKGFARLGTVPDEGVEVGVDVADAVGSLTPGVEAV